jgi:hypothetical protein
MYQSGAGLSEGRSTASFGAYRGVVGHRGGEIRPVPVQGWSAGSGSSRAIEEPGRDQQDGDLGKEDQHARQHAQVAESQWDTQRRQDQQDDLRG